MPILVNAYVRHTLGVQFAIIYFTRLYYICIYIYTILYVDDIIIIIIGGAILFSIRQNPKIPPNAGCQFKVFWCNSVIYDNNDDNILVLWFNNECGLHRGDEKNSSYDFRSRSFRGGLRPHTVTIRRSIFIYNIIYYVNIIIIIIIVCSLTISYDQFYTKKNYVYRLLGGEQKTNSCATQTRFVRIIFYKNRETCCWIVQTNDLRCQKQPL